MAELGAEPDIVIGCVGGGSNFGGIAFPFVRKNLREGKKTRFIAVEPEACPSITKGDLKYDHGDTAGMTPFLYMHTLGMGFVPAPIHAGGLRYHGMAPLVSHLVSMGVVEPRAYSQEKIFEVGKFFFKTEGILPAPESSHAVAAAIDEALEAKKQNKEKVILFNLSGHGLLDINAFAQNGSNGKKAKA
jgi:tryptophan synthase beta chain